MPIQNLSLLSVFGASKVPILVPKLGHLRQKFNFDFTVVILKIGTPNKQSCPFFRQVRVCTLYLHMQLIFFFKITRAGQQLIMIKIKTISKSSELCVKDKMWTDRLLFNKVFVTSKYESRNPVFFMNLKCCKESF